MNQERRAMLAIGLCLVVVVAWSMLTSFFQKKPPRKRRDPDRRAAANPTAKPTAIRRKPANPAAPAAAPQVEKSVASSNSLVCIAPR